MGFVAVQIPVLVEVADGHTLPAGCASVQEEADFFAAQLYANLLQLVPSGAVAIGWEERGIRVVGVGGVSPEDQPDGPVRELGLHWEASA